MSEPQRQVMQAGSMRDVVALVPFECGFHPRHSVVVLSLRGPRRRIGQVTRLDLPAAGDPGGLADLLRHVATFVAGDRGQGSVVIVYDDQAWDAQRPPHLGLVTTLLAELERAGVPAHDAMYVSPARYWSYLCRRTGCCPSEGGSVAEAMSSPMAAALVLAGLAPLPSREDLAARVHPSRPPLVAAVEECAWRCLAAFAAEGGAAAVDAFGLVDQLLPAYRTGAALMTVDQAGTLVASLQDVAVRDELLLRYCRVGLPGLRGLPGLPGLPGPPGLVEQLPEMQPPDLALEEAMERLLVDLSTQVEGPLAAAPLSLLAWHSWARGEGALARIAVDRALAEDPTYRLAVLIAAVLDHGIAPEWVGAARRADEEAS
ncbi:MAG: DUF4192 domain-containing protein [Actinomycetales bacterium]